MVHFLQLKSILVMYVIVKAQSDVLSMKIICSSARRVTSIVALDGKEGFGVQSVA